MMAKEKNIYCVYLLTQLIKLSNERIMKICRAEIDLHDDKYHAYVPRFHLGRHFRISYIAHRDINRTYLAPNFISLYFSRIGLLF